MGRTALLIALMGALLTACSGSSVNGYISPAFKSGVALGFTTEGPVSAALAQELGKRGYRIIERARLDSVINEQALTQTGLLKDQQYVKAGQIINIRFLVSVNGIPFVSQFGQTNMDKPVSASVKIVDVQNGEVVGAISYTNSSMGASGSPADSMRKKSSAAVAQEIAEYIDELTHR